MCFSLIFFFFLVLQTCVFLKPPAGPKSTICPYIHSSAERSCSASLWQQQCRLLRSNNRRRKADLYQLYWLSGSSEQSNSVTSSWPQTHVWGVKTTGQMRYSTRFKHFFIIVIIICTFNDISLLKRAKLDFPRSVVAVCHVTIRALTPLCCDQSSWVFKLPGFCIQRTHHNFISGTLAPVPYQFRHGIITLLNANALPWLKLKPNVRFQA